MKNFIKILLLLIFLACTPAFAEKFYIENYVVNMNVDKNKSAQITEDIYANFTTPSHGIIREIPFPNASISNISVSQNSTKEFTGKNVSIKIGDADKLVSGPVHYTIKYTYNYEDNKNEFYHNIIGTKWEVPINKVKFTINLPAKINPNSAGFSIGAYGTKGFSEGAKYTITDGHIITGETFKPLNPKEGITFRVPVPHGYFNEYYNFMKPITVLCLFFYTILAVLLWFIYGKDKHITPIVSFELPKGINAIEAELIYNENASVKGLVALLVELANKGFLKIEQNKKNFVLHKLKNGENGTIEQDFLNAIFGKKEKITERQLETSSSYYADCEDLVKQINEKVAQVYFSEKSISYSVTCLSMFCIVGIIYCLLATLCNFHVRQLFLPQSFSSAISSIFSTLDISCLFTDAGLLPALSLCLLGSIFYFQRLDKKCLMWIGGISLGFLGVLWLFDYTNCTSYSIFNIGLVCLIIAMICTRNLPQKNPEGVSIMGQLEGLKKYIQVTKENELKLMAEKDPQYFYDVLPYAYILGVSKVWIKKLEKLMKNNSELFKDNNIYDIYYFNSFTDTMNKLSVPTEQNGGISSSSYSGSSGGGGFSGGGGGGGGGHSW